MRELVERLGTTWTSDRVREVQASGIYWVRGGRRHPVPDVLALGPFPELPPVDVLRQHEAFARLAFIASDLVSSWELLLANHGGEAGLLKELRARDGFEAVAFEAFVASMLRSAGNDVQPSRAGGRPSPEFLVPVDREVLAVECKARLPDDRTAEFLSSVEDIAQVLARRGQGEWTVQFDCDVAVSAEHAERAKSLLLAAQRNQVEVNEVIDGSVWVRARPAQSGLLATPRPGPFMADIDVAVAGIRENADVTVYARRTAEWPRLRINDALEDADHQLRGFDYGLVCIGPASAVWRPLAARGAYLRAAKRDLEEARETFARVPHVTGVALFARGISSADDGTCEPDLVLVTGPNPVHREALPERFRLVPEGVPLESVEEGAF